MKTVHELPQVISLCKEAFIEKHHPLTHHNSVLQAREQCRTAAMGGYVDECDSFGYLRISYNSCRNRHCPKCQSAKGKELPLTAKIYQVMNKINKKYF